MNYLICLLLGLTACTVKVDGPTQPTPTETVQQAPPTQTAPPPDNPTPVFPPDKPVPAPVPKDPNAVQAPVVSAVYCENGICTATLSWTPYAPYVAMTPPGFDGYVVLGRISQQDTLNQPGYNYLSFDRFHTFSGPINIRPGVHNYFAILPYYKPPYGPAIYRDRSVEVEAIAP